MSTIKTSNIQNGSSSSVNIALNTDGSATFAQMPVGPSYYGMRNKIINGAMIFDQRNNGAAGTSLGYTVDRWLYGSNQTGKFSWQQNQGSVTPPNGFTNYLGFTSSSSYTVLTGDYFHVIQPIEGINVADLAFGTAAAKTVTVSFWVRSSLTGAFGAVLRNGNATYAYPFQYTISVANTWEYKTVTIPGPTSGTWATTTSAGMVLGFGLGVGTTYSAPPNAWIAQDVATAQGVNVVSTNGATWFVTGVQLEVGSVATPFERRLYGQELALCQRYTITPDHLSLLHARTTGQLETSIMFPVVMRTAPSVSQIAAYNCFDAFGNSFTQSPSGVAYAVNGATAKGAFIALQNFSGLTQGRTYVTNAGSTGGLIFSAEL